jgi:hypothetical protein
VASPVGEPVEPAHITCETDPLETGTKFDPWTVSVKLVVVAVAAEVWLIDVIVGAITLNVAGEEDTADDPVPIWSVTLTGPATRSTEAGTTAVTFSAALLLAAL